MFDFVLVYPKLKTFIALMIIIFYPLYNENIGYLV